MLHNRAFGKKCKSRREEEERKGLLCGPFTEPSSGLEPETPSLPSRVPGKRRQPQAAGCKESRRFRSGGVCRHLRGFASALLHKCSIPTCARRRGRPLSSSRGGLWSLEPVVELPR